MTTTPNLNLDPSLSATITQQFTDLIQLALDLGATYAKVIPSAKIFTEDRLAYFCVEPRCPSYGLSPSCPPHVTGPAGFRQLQKTHQYAIAVRMEVPSTTLFSDDKGLVLRVLHDVVAGVELEAVRRGFTRSQAFAGGSCKQIFCADETDCARLSEAGECRHPSTARPSMSGFGINVVELMKTCH
jgi:predicted metal-binding protein